MELNTEHLSKFKSPWYYWYAGYRYESIFIFFACIIASWIVLGFTAGFSIFFILIFLMLDAVGLLLLAVYLLFLREYIPDIVGSALDKFAIWHFVGAFVSIIINRAITYLIACKLFGLPLANTVNALKEPNKSLKDAP